MRGVAGAHLGGKTEVFATFLRLGLTSFGGPIAHLGYFRTEFVARRRWLDDAAFADLVALCQILPGPASSQVGAAIGLRRAGPLGALAAWAGFTLPSAALLTALALAAPSLDGHATGSALHGLQLVAVAVVAQAVWGMARSLAAGRARAAIAVAAMLAASLADGAPGQLAAIAAGALVGVAACRDAPQPAGAQAGGGLSRGTGLACLACLVALLSLLPLLRQATTNHALALFDATFRSGALVFGGGHVVLPLLRAEIPPGWVADPAFIAGYGAAQAVPGPLFTFAGYLGAVSAPAPNGIIGAAIALVGIFLPGMLVLFAALPFWASLRALPRASAVLAGVNAAVVGLLAAALYHPVITGAVADRTDAALAAAGFAALVAWNVRPLFVVAALVAVAILRASA